MSRQFNATPAKRSRVPLLIGIAGPSGSGKTFSALRLATGIQRVTPGEIHVIDTEAGRALHYADQFAFQHVPFAAPFGCFDYLEAIRYCVDRGASTIVIDSASHMHEGEGGMLDQHEKAIDAAVGANATWSQRDAASWRCWKQPKADMNRFVQVLLQLKITAIFCFRAKEKLKPGMSDGKKALVSQGTMAIADDSLIYEMVVQPLLEAGSRGVPNWKPTEKGAALQTKLPGFFADILTKPGQPLDENMGELMGRWAMGEALTVAAVTTGKRPSPPANASPAGGSAPESATDADSILERVKAAATLAEVDAVSALARTASGWTEDQRKAVREAFRARRQELA